MRAARTHLAQAEADAGMLAQTAAFPAADDTSTLRMEALTPILVNIQTDNLLGASGHLAADKSGLTASDTALGKIRVPQAGDAADLAVALTDAQAQGRTVKEALTDIEVAHGKLVDARDTCVTAVGDLFTAWDARLTPLTNLSGGVDPLLAVLPAHLADLTAAETARGRLGTAWRRQNKVLEGLGVDTGALGKAETDQAKLDADVKTLAKALPVWLGRLTKDKVETLDVQIVAQEPKVIDAPADNTETGKRLKDEGQTALDSLTSIGSAADSVAEAEAGDSDLVEAGAALKDARASFHLKVDTLKAGLSRLQEALGGDRSDWIAEPVSLFYFDDVRRLMNILNPAMHEVGDVVSLKAKAAAAQAQLNQAEADRADAQASVNTRQRRLGEMKETLRQAQAKANASDATSQIFARRLTAAQRKQTAEGTKLTNAHNTLNADPNNPLKQDALDSAQRAKDTADQTVTDAGYRSTDADGDKTKSQQGLDDLKNENDSLPAAITQAEGQLETAQQAVILQRRLALAAAQAVTQSFADTRDNAPFLKADADAASRDPARRVEMYAFNDSKTIFLRGPREDVSSVKALIAKIDQPVPQARLTLWTLELDSAAGKDAAAKFDRALYTVEENLSGKRTQIAATLSLLRDAINQEVHSHTKTALPSDFIAPLSLSTGGIQRAFREADLSNPYEARLAVYADVFTGSNRKLFRTAGFDLPDPAGTTTLGEALLVLSMMQRQYKNHVLDRFEASLKDRGMFDELATYKQDNSFPNMPARRRGRQNAPPGFPGGVWFAALRRALGARQDGQTPADDPCPAQIEILGAFKRKAWERITNQMLNQAAVLNLVGTQVRQLQAHPLEDQSRQEERQKELYAERYQALDQYTALQKNLSEMRPGLSLPGFQSPDRNFNLKDLQTQNEAAQIGAVADALRERYSPDTANARVAAADQMLKEMIIAMEDDLDRQFVSPMLRNLTSELRKQGIQVGVLNRTSVLASNRLIARVDPRGTGQLAVGEEQNALQDAQQLASLTLATQTAGLSGLAGLGGALGGLDALPRQAPPALYGITNGSVFQVTPVIDPSGQALRFRFDYVASTQVQEPDGDLNPQLPRIEHHAVNTEVQLSNMELRNISQFDGNVKLGITPHKSGGIPILRDMPLLSDLPLVGWFSRRKGQAALTQQSLIFAQTTIYPTINDLVPLLAGEFQ